MQVFFFSPTICIIGSAAGMLCCVWKGARLFDPREMDKSKYGHFAVVEVKTLRFKKKKKKQQSNTQQHESMKTLSGDGEEDAYAASVET